MAQLEKCDEFRLLQALSDLLDGRQSPHRPFQQGTTHWSPQDPQELYTELDSLTVANDAVVCALKTAAINLTGASPDADFYIYKDTTTRDRVVTVLKTLFQSFQCENHEVRLGLPDNLNTVTSRQRIHMWLSLCLNPGNWQEALCDPHEGGGLFNCTENICNQLQDHSNHGKRLRLVINRDEVVGTWHSTLSEISADPSSAVSLEQMIRMAPEDRFALYREKQLWALQLGYYLLDFYDTQWDSKNILIMESTESRNDGGLLYLSFSSALPASPELLTFAVGHPVFVSFAKILLEIYTAADLHIEISPCDRKENFKPISELWQIVEKFTSFQQGDNSRYTLRPDDYYFRAVQGCLRVHKHIADALKRNMPEREVTIAIRENIYSHVVSNLERALDIWRGRIRKRRRSDSVLPNPTVYNKTGESRARDKSTITAVPLAYPTVEKDAIAVPPEEVLPPKKRKRLLDLGTELNSNPSSSNMAERFKALPPQIHFDCAVSTHPEAIAASAQKMESLIRFREDILPYSATNRDLQPVRIAIIDTGVDINHPYISHGYAPERNEPANVEFRDYSGAASPVPIDEDGHGTFIAGILLQLAPNAELFVARIGHTKDSIATDPSVDAKLEQAIKDAVQSDTDIISMSFGLDQVTRNLREAIKLALSKEIILLASAGNSGNNQRLQYPAREDRVFKIFATDQYGYKVRICPPVTEPRYSFGILGCNVESIWPIGIQPPARSARTTEHEPWTVMTGTSVSTPIVAALVAIIYEFYDKNRSLIDLGEHSAGLKTISAVREILESISCVSDEHKYNYLIPEIGHYNPEMFAVNEKHGSFDRISFFANKLTEIIRKSQV
ncbi:conserved hypothetical protein [Histoplasma capsulatum G186AR]|uniref:Uncharacterized protein n=1 Tax=Ajellomyces capsulatus (strain G186AR / H82 / ATCC MYA-2454 / RMSCC 2432) TaxID=447093 RepID=C0NYW1_AJECG|nr:uncharacterized protein HCBG_08341 [Histoplasma capsulatum G186AR]EEH03401.1 conserved hypothetical protein [Histoplasma capsulatum G186AR]